MIKKIHHAVATLGYIGYLPWMPGTFGSAAALLFVIFIGPGDLDLLLLLLLLLPAGVFTSRTAEKVLGKDSGHIVIDEFCGYLTAVLLIPKSISFLLAAFVLFRIFDILKPPPINSLERTLSGGLGIMADDVLAGLLANLCLQAWKYFFMQ